MLMAPVDPPSPLSTTGTATSPPGLDVPRRRLTRRLAWAGMALMLSVIVLSAFIRLSQSGLGCEDWPACYGPPLPEQLLHASARTDASVVMARLAHRVVATALLVLVLGLVLTTWGARPRRWGEVRLAAGLLLMTLALAALGVVSSGAAAPAVVLGNLLGGFVTLALCWRLAVLTGPAPTPTAALRRWSWLALALLLLQVALGGAIGATYAALACGGWTECTRIALSAGWDWGVLNPWFSATADTPALPQRGAWLQLLHRGGGLLLLPVLAAVGWSALRQGMRREALALVVLPLLLLVLGSLLGSAEFPLLQVLAHNLAAALLLALLARLA